MTRQETDTMGAIAVPDDRYWGAQTQRSLQNFRIGGERMPLPLIHALGLIKRAAAEVNRELGSLDDQLAETIGDVAQEIVDGRYDAEFPLVVCQTTSGNSASYLPSTISCATSPIVSAS